MHAKPPAAARVLPFCGSKRLATADARTHARTHARTLARQVAFAAGVSLSQAFDGATPQLSLRGPDSLAFAAPAASSLFAGAGFCPYALSPPPHFRFSPPPPSSPRPPLFSFALSRGCEHVSRRGLAGTHLTDATFALDRQVGGRQVPAVSTRQDARAVRCQVRMERRDAARACGNLYACFFRWWRSAHALG